MTEQRRIVALHPAAPSKPALDAPCNGCGLCCLAEPCPLGMLASRHRTGACRALEWDDRDARYRCGVLRAPSAWLIGSASKEARPLDTLLRPMVRRWIAAGIGCDADIETDDSRNPKEPQP